MKCLLMNKNYPILECEVLEEAGVITNVNYVYDKFHMPLGIHVAGQNVNIKQLNDWWQSRTIPASREGLMQILLKVNVTSTTGLAIKALGLSLSDQYWMNPGGLHWEDVNFFTNDFSEDMGDFIIGKRKEGHLNLMSPDNTSDGWLKKRWKIIDGKRYLMKGGSRPYLQEPLNEVIATRLMERIPVQDFVRYGIWREEKENYSICANFVTEHTEYIPAIRIYKSGVKESDTSNYQHLLHMCDKLGVPDMRPMLDYMLTIDYLMANEDRHLGNFGVIRNVNTLEYPGMAPVFDTGSSLYYKSQDTDIRMDADIGAKPFAASQEQQLGYVSSFDSIDIKNLQDFPEEMREIFREYNTSLSQYRIGKLCSIMGERIHRLEEIITTKVPKQFWDAKMSQTQALSPSLKQLEKELLKEGIIPTDTMLSCAKQIYSYMGTSASLAELRQLYEHLADVPAAIRDTVMQLGNELVWEENKGE